MNGIINVFKMPKWTSFDVVAKLRGITATRQIGHMGTLDPMATGVLPVFIGDATKAIDLQPNHEKEYYVSFMCGIKTDTGDIGGDILQKSPVLAQHNMQKLKEVIPSFIGDLMQIPPMYSAVKINGKPLYKLAREGKDIERKPRPITVHKIVVDESEIGPGIFSLTIRCSKGTYIRTLVEDIANAMGTIATTTALTRTKSGVFSIGNAYTLEQIQQEKNNGNLSNLILDTEIVFKDLPSYNASDKEIKLLLNGVKLKSDLQNGMYKVYAKGQLIGKAENTESFAGICTVNDSELRVKKLFVKR